MATTVTKPAHPLETPPAYALIQQNAMSDACILSRLSKWLWLSWACDRPDSHKDSLGPQCETSAKTVPRHLTLTDVEIRSDTSNQLEDAFPCRACQAWGVECDRQKPRCSHCLDQQILCFYVEPLRVTMKRSKELKKLPSARTEPVTS
ncbi:hypothetical protein BDW59DRAFT_170144 [Aspergillus cavernicola]|uniref:Zn(2)-C6 fungal-type domain-containing protein n=1 Tax=Aspergillus cavernicola TaxID=176166 RepID=A0ABR4ISP2_9EURO